MIFISRQKTQFSNFCDFYILGYKQVIRHSFPNTAVSAFCFNAATTITNLSFLDLCTLNC